MLEKNSYFFKFMLVFAVSFVIIVSGGLWFYSTQEKQVRQRAEWELETVAQLKANQIAAWRAERLADATDRFESPFFEKALAQWIADPTPGRTEEMKARFRSLQKNQRYHDILLVSPEGRILLSLAHRGHLHEEALKAIKLAFRSGKASLSDLHFSPEDLEPHIEAIAPFFSTKDGAPKPICAILLMADARKFLFPLIQSWPTPSRTAETLLVRREGDTVLFLNDLRHKKDTTLKLRIPLTEAQLPAAMAVEGREGIVEGKDYRGVHVLACVKAIPDSPWFLVAKEDAAEVFAPWRLRSILILALIVLQILALAALAAVIWHWNEKRHYQALFQSEEARRRGEERYRTTLMSVGDGVIATDVEGRVEVLNPAAEGLTGWPRDEAFGKPLEEVFVIINEQTRNTVENPVRLVMQKDMIIGLANHTLLIARDGTERPIADSGAPIRDEKGEITGVVLVFRDQTEQRAAHKALLESEEKYRTLINTTGDLIYTTNKRGFITYVNPSLEKTLGYHPGELNGRSFTDILAPEFVEKARDIFTRALKGESIPVYEGEMIRRDGTKITLEFNTETLYDENGNPTGRYGIGRDITERRKAEREQALLTRRLEGLWRLAQLAEADYDTFSDHVLSEILDITGSQYGFYGVMDCEEKEMHTLSWSKHARADCNIEAGPLVFPVESAGIWAESIRQRKPIVVNDYSEAHPAKKGLPEGHVKLTRLMSVPVLVQERIASIAAVANKETPYTDEDLKQLDAFISSAQIVLEKKKSEEELKKAEAKYRSIFENAVEGIYQSTPDGRVISANPAFARMLGYGSAGELIDSVTDIATELYVKPDQRAELIRLLDEHCLAAAYEVQMYRKDRSIIWLSLNVRAVKDEKGNILFLEGMAEDITERKRSEEELLSTLNQLQEAKDMLVQSEKLAAIGRLSAGVGHEILNPLNIISMRIQLLEVTERLSDKVKDGFATMMRQIDRIVRITKDLSQFSRIAKKRDLVEKDIHQLVEHILFLVTPRLRLEQVTLETHLKTELPAVPMEPDRIEQVILNIINNAVDAMEGKEKKTIRITTDSIKEDGRDFARLVISDNGKGMKPEILDKIFEPFFTTKEAGKGTGLGLHICYTIIQDHGGRIRAENNAEGGAAFFIDIPVEAEEVRG